VNVRLCVAERRVSSELGRIPASSGISLQTQGFPQASHITVPTRTLTICLSRNKTVKYPRKLPKTSSISCASISSTLPQKSIPPQPDAYGCRATPKIHRTHLRLIKGAQILSIGVWPLLHSARESIVGEALIQHRIKEFLCRATDLRDGCSAWKTQVYHEDIFARMSHKNLVFSLYFCIRERKQVHVFSPLGITPSAEAPEGINHTNSRHLLPSPSHLQPGAT